MRENTYFEECIKQADLVREENKEIKADFEKSLQDLSEDVKDRHMDHVDDYINHYLLYYEPTRAVDGISRLEEYFASFLIRKGLCESPAVMKEKLQASRNFINLWLTVKGLQKQTMNVYATKSETEWRIG